MQSFATGKVNNGCPLKSGSFFALRKMTFGRKRSDFEVRPKFAIGEFCVWPEKIQAKMIGGLIMSRGAGPRPGKSRP